MYNQNYQKDLDNYASIYEEEHIDTSSELKIDFILCTTCNGHAWHTHHKQEKYDDLYLKIKDIVEQNN